MDLLKPEIIRIGNRCYRLNPTGFSTDFNEDRGYQDNWPENNVYEDEHCDIDSTIEQTKNEFRTSLDVPVDCHKFIIGKKGESKKTLERETNTRVTVPSIGQTGKVVITGVKKRDVISAKTRLELIISNARQKIQFTHFLSITIAKNNEIKSSFNKFKEVVLETKRTSDSIDESLFQTSDKLHITLGVLVLLNKTEIDELTEVLDEFRANFLRPMLNQKGMEAKIEGLEIMNDDPSEVDILYAKVTKCDALKAVVEALMDRLNSTRFVQKQYDRVKMHVTLMNSLFRSTNNTRKSFNCSNILSKFGDYSFGTLKVDSILLSKRFSTDNDGYYETVTSLNLKM